MDRSSLVGFGLVCLLALPSVPQADEGTSENDLKQANNPLANMKALNFQNYYVPNLYGLPDETSNTFWFRYAQPVGRVLVRASLPLSTVPTGQGDPTSGLGDFNIFGAYLLAPATAPTQYGVGPLLVVPTASEDALGSGKWQAGAAAVVYSSASPQVQFGGLATWQVSFAGESDRSNTNAIVLQPFGFWQLGKGTYLRTAPLWVFNLESGDYNVPFGFGIGKITKVGSTVFNIFIEPQFTMLHDGVGQPAFQVFTALNLQFLGH
jgi:hypothetical protein